MSEKIKLPSKLTWSARAKLLVQIVRGVNPLFNLQGSYSRSATAVSFNYSTESVTLVVPDPQPKIDALQAQINALESRVSALE